MSNQADTRQDSVESTELLADLWWLEYQDAAREARDSLRDGDNLKALALAIRAHRIRGEYEYHANRLIFR